MATLSSKTGLPSFSQSITEINYFTDGGFERGTNGQIPTGWAQYQDAAAAAPVDGTGGTAVPTVTMLCSNSSPIRGTLSAVISKDAVNRQGVGFSFPFTISPADAGVTSGVSFELQTSAAYASGDMVFYIYDVTNSLLITPRAVSIPKMDSYGKFFSDFGLTSGTQYRFILHIATVNASAWTLKIDTLVNTPTKAAVPGSAVYEIPLTASVIGATNSLAYTNTTVNSLTGVRVNNFLEVTAKLSFTGLPAVGTGALVVRVSTSGMTIDPAKIQNWSGSGVFYDGTGGQMYNLSPAPYMTGTNIDIQFAVTGESPSTAYLNPASVPVAFANGDLLSFDIRIPITEFIGAANFGPGASGEYAYSTDVSATSNPGNSASSAIGSQGVSFSALWAVGTTYVRRVRFQTPKQTNESVELYTWSNGQLISASEFGWPRQFQGTKAYGYNIVPVAGGGGFEFDIVFNDGGYVASNATYGLNGGPWSALNADFKWVARKFNPSSPVGFGPATATQQGLISSEFASSEGDLGTITIGGGTWTTIDTKKYRWNKIGKQVTFFYRLESTTLASALTGVNFILPSDCPTPVPLSNGGTNEWTGITGNAGTAPSLGGSDVQGRSNIYNSAGTFVVYHSQPSTGSALLWGSFTYMTS